MNRVTTKRLRGIVRDTMGVRVVGSWTDKARSETKDVDDLRDVCFSIEASGGELREAKRLLTAILTDTGYEGFTVRSSEVMSDWATQRSGGMYLRVNGVAIA